MLLLVLLCLITAILLLWSGFAMGQQWRELSDRISEIAQVVVTMHKAPKPTEPQETGATLIDPSDPVQRAKWERDQLMKGLNPSDDDLS